MSILIQITPSLEDRLKEKALKNGLRLDQFVSQFLEHTFSETPPSTSVVWGREAELLQKINLDIPPETWQLYEALKRKHEKHIATEEESKQLVLITNQVEEANVRRIAVLLELAQIRSIPIQILMQQLGLTKHE